MNDGRVVDIGQKLHLRLWIIYVYVPTLHDTQDETELIMELYLVWFEKI